MSKGHREAFAHLLYGVQGTGGFVLLTGEVGTGKTTVCRCLLEQIPENSNIAIILNPKVTALELLASICDELQIPYDRDTTSIKVFTDHINEYLLEAHAKGNRTVLIIDEAQNLEPAVLEQIRLLTNLETHTSKLLQIIMLGQPELLEKLERPDLRQLAQRITARFHLGPLQKEDIRPYVSHRLAVSGITHKVFSDDCFNRLHSLSGGIPRLINILCDRAMLGAYVQEQNHVDEQTLSKAAKEVFGKTAEQAKGKGNARRLTAPLVLAVICAVAISVVVYVKNTDNDLSFSHASLKTKEAAVVIEPEATESTQITTDIPLPAPHQEKEAESVAPNLDTWVEPEGPPDPIAGTVIQQTYETIDWPPDQPMKLTKQSAYKNLFRQWNLEYLPADKLFACQQAQTLQLACLHLKGDIDYLSHLNRPAILRFYDDNFEIYHATLVGIGDQSATLLFGDVQKEVLFNEFDQHWFGNFTLLWRPPPGYQNVLKPGEKGAIVKWLAETITDIEGAPVQLSNDLLYDANLEQRVKKIQMREALTPDGKVGPKTIIKLNTAAKLDVPVLMK